MQVKKILNSDHFFSVLCRWRFVMFLEESAKRCGSSFVELAGSGNDGLKM